MFGCNQNQVYSNFIENISFSLSHKTCNRKNIVATILPNVDDEKRSSLKQCLKTKEDGNHEITKTSEQRHKTDGKRKLKHLRKHWKNNFSFYNEICKDKRSSCTRKMTQKNSFRKMGTDCGLRQGKNETKHKEKLLVSSYIF